MKLDPRGMKILNERLQSVPSLRNVLLSADYFERTFPTLSTAERDNMASALVHGAPARSTGFTWGKLDRLMGVLGDIALGQYDAQARSIGISRQQFLQRVAHASGVDPELRDYLTERASAIVGGGVMSKHIAAREAGVEGRKPKYQETPEDRARRAPAQDRNSRRAEIERQIDGAEPPARLAKLYDPADHAKPGSQGRRADIALAMAQAGARERYGVDLDNDRVPIEMVESVESDSSEAGQADADWETNG